MAIRARSLISNSVGSILASGMLLFSTILIPAVLARALSPSEFQTYSIALAALPLMMVLPQSARSVGASQIALAATKHDIIDAIATYRRFIAGIGVAHVVLCTAGVEAYLALGHPTTDSTLMRIGAYAILAYTVGLIVVGLVIVPSAAQRNFLPDNIAKFWPGLVQLVGITAIWIAGIRPPLPWIFLIYLASSWSIAALLLAFNGNMPPTTVCNVATRKLTREFIHGLRGVLWWNVTAYLATTATVMVVAVAFPQNIVPFSIATSLLGVVAAVPIAVSGPIAVHATTMISSGENDRRKFFLRVNTIFQVYIGVAALFIFILPSAVYHLWLNAELADEVRIYCLWLLPAMVIRLLTMNFTIFVMSAGRQHTLWLSPLVEAVMSIVGSIVLGWLLGVAGIAMALTLSATTRLLLTLLHDERLNQSALALRQGDMLLSGLRLGRRPEC